MNMKIIKRYNVLLVLVLVVIVGVFFFCSRLYHNDINALEGFVASYEKFDKEILDFSNSKTDDSESKAGDALIKFNSKASFRLSSLIKNDWLIPHAALEIADLSGRELESLKAYKRAIQTKNADLDDLAKEYSDLTSQRKNAYARFQGLRPE